MGRISPRFKQEERERRSKRGIKRIIHQRVLMLRKSYEF